MDTLSVRAQVTTDLFQAKNLTLATAESCTGGLIAAALTAIAGSSAVVDRGFVTYSNEAKTEALGVPADLIAQHGAVSEAVARAMAAGALERSRADVAVSVTGIAGPGGGSADKPVGLVHFACARRGGTLVHVERRFGDLGRAEVRAMSVLQALELADAAAGGFVNASYRPVPLPDRAELTDAQMIERARAVLARMRRRHTVREFSDRPVPRAVIEACIAAAGTAPSGANQQPWRFVLIGPGPLRTRLREAAENEEREFYASRASAEWLEALGPLGTDASKPFLEVAPWLVAIFGQRYGEAEGRRTKHYYVPESVGIATGFLIAALHEAGLATLTHTPSPMGFLNEALGRPENEKAYILLVVGHPAADATVPAHAKEKLPLDTILIAR